MSITDLASYLRRIQKVCGEYTIGTYATPSLSRTGSDFYGFERHTPWLEERICEHLPGLYPAKGCDHPPLVDDPVMPPIKRSEAYITKAIDRRGRAGYNRIHCACGLNLNNNDAQGALSAMQDKIGTGDKTLTDKNTNVVVGSVIAFMCYGETIHKYTITADLYHDYLEEVKSACGQDIAGTYSWYGPTGMPMYDHHWGYMRYAGPGSEDHVCDHPNSASAQTCHPSKRSEDRALLTPASPSIANSLETRKITEGVHCGCGSKLNPDNLNKAIVAVKNQLIPNSEVTGGVKHIEGDVIAFICMNGYMSPKTSRIDGNLWTERMNAISGVCGAYTAGTYADPQCNDRNDSPGDGGVCPYFYYGYMRYPGAGFEDGLCQTPASAAAASCPK